MKNIKIVLINALIALIVLSCVSLYTVQQKQKVYKGSVSSFENTAKSMEKIMASYLISEQQLINSWAHAINKSFATMDEAIDFAGTVLGESRAAVHIIWKDDYSQGLSTQVRISDETNHKVSYVFERKTHSYEVSPEVILKGITFDFDKVHMTTSYSDPITGNRVVAFGQQVVLSDNGKKRDAIMLYVLPVEYLKEKWVFATEYSDVSIALIEGNGNYIIQPRAMKNTNFYEFIYSYNKIPQEDIENQIRTIENGSFYAKDVKGINNIYAFALLEDQANYAMILGMPQKNLISTSIEWPTILVTLVALLSSLVLNTIFFNIASKKEHEQYLIIQEQGFQLENALVEAQNASNAKTSFLSNMSHDIRTPMNAIIGYTGLMKKEIDKPEVLNDYIEKIQDSSEYLLSLINNVLDMARIESGQAVLSENLYDIKDSGSQIYSVFVNDLKRKNLTLNAELHIEHNCIYCDELKLKQIMLNLLSNSIKYTNEGGTINIELREFPSSKKGYSDFLFKIVDNGIGMSEEFLPHIFESFTREKNSTESKVVGTGLGMPIVKKIVEMMGGSITVESKQGVGTTVCVKLTHRYSDIKQAVNSEYWNSSDAQIDFTGKKILLAEDNELNAEIAITVLENFGFEVAHVEDGVKCVELLENNPAGSFDLILMDIQMPNMNGYEATVKIRHMDDKVKAGIPIVAMTANAFEEDKREALKVGMNGHISKPIEVKVMLNLIAKLLKL